LAEYGVVVVQIHPKEDAPVALEQLQEYDRRRYGGVMLIFYANAAELAKQNEESDTDEENEEDEEDEEDRRERWLDRPLSPDDEPSTRA
jgi:hypothetical protein